MCLNLLVVFWTLDENSTTSNRVMLLLSVFLSCDMFGQLCIIAMHVFVSQQRKNNYCWENTKSTIIQWIHAMSLLFVSFAVDKKTRQERKGGKVLQCIFQLKTSYQKPFYGMRLRSHQILCSIKYSVSHSFLVRPPVVTFCLKTWC